MNKTVLRDVILIASVLILSTVLFFAFYGGRSVGRSFEITVNGKLYGVYPLDADTTVDIDGLCTVEVKGGEVSVISSVCPGKDCVHHKPVKMSGERIVCLPNGIVIRVSGDGVDAVI